MFTLWCSVRCGSFCRHTGFADSVHRFLVFENTHTHTRSHTHKYLGTYTVFTVWTTCFPCLMPSINNFVSLSFLTSHPTNTNLFKNVVQSEYIWELWICLLMWTGSSSEMLMYECCLISGGWLSCDPWQSATEWLSGTVCPSCSVCEQQTKLKNCRNLLVFKCCMVAGSNGRSFIIDDKLMNELMQMGNFGVAFSNSGRGLYHFPAYIVSLFFFIQLLPLFHSHLHFLIPFYRFWFWPPPPLFFPITPLPLCNLAG